MAIHDGWIIDMTQHFEQIHMMHTIQAQASHATHTFDLFFSKVSNF